MRTAKKLFNQVKTYDDIKNIIRDNADYLNNGYFNIETLSQGIDSLYNLSIEKQPKIVEFAHQLDQSMSLEGLAKQNSYHKIPTLLAGIIYYDKYYDEIMSYSLDEQTILAKFSIIKSLEFYQNATKEYTKEVVSCIADKNTDFMIRSDLMFLTQELLNEGKNTEEIITHIASTPQDELLEDVYKRETELIKPILGGIVLWK